MKTSSFLSFPLACLLAILPGGLQQARAAGADTNSEPLPRPLVIDAALDYALRHNPTLNRIREQVREQEGVLISVNAARLPQAGLHAQETRSDRELLSTVGGSREAWQVEARVSQVLYAGGGLQASSAGQRSRVEAARLEVQAQSAATVLAVRQAFYQVLLNRELIVVQEAELGVLEKEAADAKVRRDAGSGSDFDLLRANVAVANAKPALSRVRNAYRTSIDGLRLQLGAPPLAAGAAEPQPEGSLAPAGQTPDLIDCLRAARDSRPELLRQEQLSKAADRGIDAARAGYQPTVSAYAAYDWVSNPFTTTGSSRLDGAVVGVQADLSLFDGRSTAGKVRQARSQARQLAHGTDELVLAVDYEVRTAHSALVLAAELLGSADMTVAQAEESLRMARARQAAGTATQLDVLTAQSALTQARSSLSNARFDHMIAMAQLEKATGAIHSLPAPQRQGL